MVFITKMDGYQKCELNGHDYKGGYCTLVLLKWISACNYSLYITTSTPLQTIFESCTF
jgi:hypothetical protein